jgi:hypothetical protein
MIVLREYAATFVEECDRRAIPQRYPKSHSFNRVERKHFVDRIEKCGKTFACEAADHHC